MAVFAPIPLPGSDNSQFKDVMDFWAQLQQQKAQREQANQLFGLKQQEEEREQQLLPHKIQEYQNKEAREKQEQDFYKRLFGNNANPQQSNQPQTVNNDQTPGNASLSSKVPLNYDEMQKQLATGAEVTVRQPQPGREMWDNFAGQQIGHIKIPDIKSKVVDGIREDTYPSGRIVRQKEGPTAEEKARINLNTAEEKEQAKTNIQNKTKDDAYFKTFGRHADNNEAIAHVMERAPTATGLFSSGKKYLKVGSKELGEFNRLAVPMQGELAKELSQRGGAVALTNAREGKYDPTQHLEYNQGILRSTNDAIIRDYNREADLYREKYGKEPPYKLSKYYRDWEKNSAIENSGAPEGSVYMYRNGDKYAIPVKEADVAYKEGYRYGR